MLRNCIFSAITLSLVGCGGAAAEPAVPIGQSSAPAVEAAEPAPPPAPPAPVATPSSANAPPAGTTPSPPRQRRTTTAPATLSGKDPACDEILHATTSNVMKQVLAAPENYRFQVLYSIVKEGGAKPVLERHGWRTDAEYFFPASSMKVPIALAAYERMNVLRKSGKAGFTRDATMKIHPSKGSGEPYTTTLARETMRALIVSDNFSANRLLAITGHREIHETDFGLGLASTRVRTGFATGEPIDPAEVSPRIVVGDVELPARKSTLVLPANDAKNLDIGDAYINDNGQRVTGPMPFKEKNAMKLQHLQDAMIRIMRPDLLPSKANSIYSANASSDPTTDVGYLRETLGTLPSESGLAGYDRNVMADYPLSPFLRGIERVRPRGQSQIFQKVGQAYGFLIHNAYIVDKATKKSFFLTAAIYGNADGVMNDDKYDYDSVSFPALADVGEAFTRDAFVDDGS